MQKGEETVLTIEEMSKILDLNEKVWKDVFKKFEKFVK